MPLDRRKGPVGRQVLATCLDQVLRLLHPMVPFVTETLWAGLGEIAPERGVLAKLDGIDGLLVRAPWPQADAATWRDEALEARVASGQELVASLREVGARYQVAPSQKVPVRIQAGGESGAKLEGPEALIANMAGADSVEIDATVERSKDAATAVVRDVECHVLGVVDLEQEKKKLEKERDGLAKRVEGPKRKLGNQGFVAKAPLEVVEQGKARLADMEQQLAKLEARLTEL